MSDTKATSEKVARLLFRRFVVPEVQLNGMGRIPYNLSISNREMNALEGEHWRMFETLADEMLE